MSVIRLCGIFSLEKRLGLWYDMVCCCVDVALFFLTPIEYVDVYAQRTQFFSYVPISSYHKHKVFFKAHIRNLDEKIHRYIVFFI